MSDSLKSHVLIVTDEDKKLAQEGINMDDFDKCVDDILEWCSKEQHLAHAVKYFNRNALESLYISTKGSTEGMKQKIEKILTSRGMVPELVLNRSPEEFDKYLEIINFVVLPKLYPKEQSRIMISKIAAENVDEINMLDYFRYNFLVGEYRGRFDYCLGERFIIDMKNVPMSMLTKFNPIVMKKADFLAHEGYGAKIKGVHIINASSFTDKFVFLLKQTMKPKVAARVHIHNSYEDLHKHIPKEILPKEYGGDEESCDVLARKMQDELKRKEIREYIASLDHFVADESKRIASAKFSEQYMGMPGSFKRLNVD